MPDNDVKLKDYSDTPISFFPRTVDRGNNVRENVNSLAKSDGTRINPATTEDIGAAGNTPPALPTNASGIIGWLRQLVDTVAGTLTVKQFNGRQRDTSTSAVSGTIVAINESRHGIASVRSTFTRPADTTSYTIGDLVAHVTGQNNATDGTGNQVPVFAAGEGLAPVLINELRMSKSSASLTNAVFRVHLFADIPATSANIGDNAVLNTAPGADKTVLGGNFNCSKASSKIGSFTITMGESYTDGAWGRAIPDGNTSIQANPASGKALYFLIEALGSYTPASAESFTLDFGVVRDGGL